MKKIVQSLPLLLAPLLFFGCEKQEEQQNIPLIRIGENGVEINSTNGQNILNLSDDGVQLNTESGESLLNLNNDGVNIGDGIVSLGENGVNISNILKLDNSGIVLNNPTKITQILNGTIGAKEITIQDVQDLQKLKTSGYLKNIDLSKISVKNSVTISGNNRNAEEGVIDNMKDKGTEGTDVEVVSCEMKYKDLVNMNYFDFSACTNTDIRNSDINIKESEIPTQSMVLIFDASGSMAAQINGKSRMEIAKKSVSKFLKTLDGNEKFKLSIVLYGHKGSNTSSLKNLSCNGIEEVMPLSVIDVNNAENIVSKFQPTGWTPIASSLVKAQNILSQDNSDKKYILLVSDGKETCGGNPVEIVKNIKSKDSEIIVNVIGFDVDADTGSQLQEIAKAGDGKYFDVSTEQQFAEALNENKKQVQKVDYALGRSIEQIYDMSYITHTYMQCTAALERENAVMKIDINGTELLGGECKEYANNRYTSRYEEVQEIIEENYKNSKEEFNKNKSLIFVK